MQWIGIDFGSKLAGTTAICFMEKGVLKAVQSLIKHDADQWIKEFVVQHKPDFIFIDAPLSLPLACREAGDDFFYRKADRLLGGMSPMFLGGLTARAMQLAFWCKQNAVEVKETYPANTARLLFGANVKDEERKKCVRQWLMQHNIVFEPDCLKSPHTIDSVLAWIAGKRFSKGDAVVAGIAEEGLIYC